MYIFFHFENINKPYFFTSRKKKLWLLKLSSIYKKELNNINYIFLSDSELLDINNQYLNHNYYTDIITFDNSEVNNIIDADIFISLDRVKDNAKQLKVSYQQELLRVMAHGLLHLVGYEDKTKTEQEAMRQAENNAIALYQSLT